MEGTHLSAQPDDLTCSLLAAQVEPVLHPAGAGNRAGGRWEVGGGIWGVRQLELGDEEDTSPLSGRRPFSSFLRPKVLGLLDKTQFGGRGVATGSWRRGQSGECQGSFEFPG